VPGSLEEADFWAKLCCPRLQYIKMWDANAFGKWPL